MKKFFQRVVLVVVAIATAQGAMAESWRINHDQSTGAHFASINVAMGSDVVKDGDILYLDPGCVLSDAQTITKAVTVIGTGWGYSHLPYTYAHIDGNLTINNAAKVVGVEINKNVYPNYPNIELERCRITGNIQPQSGTTNSGLKIIGCMIKGILKGYSSSNPATNWEIYNSVLNINGGINFFTTCSIVNCYIKLSIDTHPLLTLQSCTIKNNIILNTQSRNKISSSDFTGNTFANNVLSADENYTYAEGNRCANSVTLTDFIVNTGAGGAEYQLSVNSPAKSAGEGGIDCGPYAEGSLYPFVTYGLPKNIPYFEGAVIPTQPTDGKISVTLKIKTQNQ